mmetsp:Transcript_61424/g.176207  ORF Transcript_61424/g.176207 Transcript_61424/m.176207 type:complete len:669 (-) Transcript_61424:56-2062(-)
MVDSMTSMRSLFLQKSQGRPGQCYDPVQKLGEGAFGVAHLVKDKRTAVLRVLKTINKRQSQVPNGQLEKEIRNLKACDHPHIVRLFEYYEDYENIYLVMEHAEGGELHQVVEAEKKRGQCLPERWVAVVIRQCLMAVAHVHAQGIIHKDLKSENILLLKSVDPQDPQAHPHAVIIDLGIAELFSARLGRRARCTVVAGTPTHMAPEVWRGNFGPVADVWSLGVVMFELIVADIPFLCSSLNSPQEWLRMHRQGPNWSLLNRVSNQARAINQRMLNWDERMRPTAQQCLGHSWFKENGALEEAGPDEAETEEAGKAVDASPLGSARQPQTEVVQALGDYMGKSRFEKAVCMQVASQCHLAQMGRVSEVFCNADRDMDGTVSKDELMEGLGKLGVDPADAESYAACVDVNSDGRIEYTELASGCMGLLYESLRGLLWQSFCILDVDGNGVLSPEEILTVLSRAELAQHGFPGEELEPSLSVQEALNSLDLDRNGQISFDELCRVFIPRPAFGSQPQDQGGPGGQALLSSRKSKIMHDEEFAQLLDEIEADNDAAAAVAAVSSSGMPPLPPSPLPPLPEHHSGGVGYGRSAVGFGDVGSVGQAGVGLGGLGGLHDEGFATGCEDLSADLAAVGMGGSLSEAPKPMLAGGAAQANVHMTVEEELSNLLADIG